MGAGEIEQRLVRLRAFDTVARIQSVSTTDELERVVSHAFEELGFSAYVGFTHVAAGGKPDVSVLFGRTHAEWERRYSERGYQNTDAVIPIAMARSDPFYWSETPLLRPLQPAEQRVFDEAAEYGLKDGLVVPSHHLDGSISSVLLCGAHIEARDPHLRAAAHLLALYFGSVGQRLIKSERAQLLAPVRLTPRQLDCLRWVREGKSSTDIADILGVSTHTIETHIARACQALGVRTRVQAVAEAALRGLIQL